MQPYPACPAPEFNECRAAFEAMLVGLSGAEAAGLDHSGAERRVDDEGEEVKRLVYQGFLNLCAAREKASHAPVRGADGETRTEFRPSSRPLGVLFGTVVVHRLAVVKHGVSGGLHPLDAHLNLPEGRYSCGVQREIAWGVSQTSYDAAVENLRRKSGTTIAKRQAEDLVVSFARDFRAFYFGQAPQPECAEHLLVLTFDGSGIVMRPEGLRPETRKRAENNRRKSTAETSADVHRAPDSPNRKRMAEVAAVYSLEVLSRTPEDVMRELRRSGPRKVRPKATNKRVWASVERSIDEVVYDAVMEALQRDTARKRRWVVLVDGDPDQIQAVKRHARSWGVDVTIVVDFIHVLGYLWNAAKVLNPDAAPAVVEAWVTERAERILRGEVSRVAAGVRRSATFRALEETERTAVDKCANYLLNHKEYLRYHEYLRDGLPIATGVIEGACRSLVKDRMDITGARWGLAGAEAVLKVRSLRASGDFDEYAAFHERRELERNHLDRYDEHELVDLRDAA